MSAFSLSVGDSGAISLPGAACLRNRLLGIATRQRRGGS
jgi:hypothetical protein